MNIESDFWSNIDSRPKIEIIIQANFGSFRSEIGTSGSKCRLYRKSDAICVISDQKYFYFDDLFDTLPFEIPSCGYVWARVALILEKPLFGEVRFSPAVPLRIVPYHEQTMSVKFQGRRRILTWPSKGVKLNMQFIQGFLVICVDTEYCMKKNHKKYIGTNFAQIYPEGFHLSTQSIEEPSSGSSPPSPWGFQMRERGWKNKTWNMSRFVGIRSHWFRFWGWFSDVTICGARKRGSYLLHWYGAQCTGFQSRWIRFQLLFSDPILPNPFSASSSFPHTLLSASWVKCGTERCSSRNWCETRTNALRRPGMSVIIRP